jgi:hypothetical protein
LIADFTRNLAAAGDQAAAGRITFCDRHAKVLIGDVRGVLQQRPGHFNIGIADQPIDQEMRRIFHDRQAVGEQDQWLQGQARCDA